MYALKSWSKQRLLDEIYVDERVLIARIVEEEHGRKVIHVLFEDDEIVFANSGLFKDKKVPEYVKVKSVQQLFHDSPDMDTFEKVMGHAIRTYDGLSDGDEVNITKKVMWRYQFEEVDFNVKPYFRAYFNFDDLDDASTRRWCVNNMVKSLSKFLDYDTRLEVYSNHSYFNQ
jgi:hypothetical protein